MKLGENIHLMSRFSCQNISLIRLKLQIFYYWLSFGLVHFFLNHPLLALEGGHIDLFFPRSKVHFLIARNSREAISSSSQELHTYARVYAAARRSAAAFRHEQKCNDFSNNEPHIDYHFYAKQFIRAVLEVLKMACCATFTLGK